MAPDPADAFDEVFDADFLSCSQLACVDVYQGEGVSHPQLIVTMFHPSGGVTEYVTYIHDFPPGESPSLSIYLNNSLISRTAETGGQPLTASGAQGLMRLALVIAAGIEQAYFAPQTYEYGLWPGPAELAEAVDLATDMIPGGVTEWDASQGGGGGGNGGGDDDGHPGHSRNAVGGLTTDPCERNPLLCEPFGDAQANGPTSFAAPSVEARRLAIRQRARLARALTSVDNLAADGAAVQSGAQCSWVTLIQEDSLDQCVRRCAICDANRLEQLHAAQLEWGATCAATVGYVGGGLALATAVKTGGGSLVVASAGASGFTAATGVCTGLVHFLLSGQYASRKETCEYICGWIAAHAN
jgi:hypothetical protein